MPITCFSLISGSASQIIKVYSLNGENLSTIRYHDGFMGQRIGPISCLAFHPHRVSKKALAVKRETRSQSPA